MDAMTLARLPFLVCHRRSCPNFTEAWSGYVAIGGNGNVNGNHGRCEFSCDFRHESDALRHLLTGSIVLSKRLDHCCAALLESGGTFFESVVNLLNQPITRLSDLVFSFLHLRCEGAIPCLDRVDLSVNRAAACAQQFTPLLRLLPIDGATFSDSAMNVQRQMIKTRFTCVFADWLPCSEASRRAGSWNAV